MKILYLVHQFYPEFCTGTEKFALQMAKMMQKLGNEVKVITYSFYGDAFFDRIMGNVLLREFLFEGIPVLAFKHKKEPRDLNYGLENEDLAKISRELIAREKPDVIHVAHPLRVHELIRTSKTLGIPYILTLTDFWLICPKTILTNSRGDLCDGPREGATCRSFCPEFSEKFIINRLNLAKGIISNAKLVVTPSRFAANVFKKEFAWARIKIINHGISYSKIKGNNKFYNNQDKLIFAYRGSLNPHKGVHILIEAFKMVRANNVTLKVFGSGPDPSYVNMLFDMARDDERIKLCGVYPEDQAKEILSDIDVTVVPSIWWESYSLVLHESLACNVPVIASNIGGMAEKIKDGVNGFVFEVGNPFSLKEALERIVNNPRVLNELKIKMRGFVIPTIEQEAYAYWREYKK